jgi:hypothetical protein
VNGRPRGCGAFSFQDLISERGVEARMVRGRSILFAPERMAQIAYNAGSVPVAVCAAMLGLSPRGFLQRRRVLGWPTRRRTGRRADPAAALIVTLPTPPGPVDRLATGRAMERFIAGRIEAYEARAAGEDPEPERTARTVTHYARALGLVRDYLADLEKGQGSDGGAPGRTLSELRDELARHLERIWDEGRDAGGVGGEGPQRS